MLYIFLHLLLNVNKNINIMQYIFFSEQIKLLSAGDGKCKAQFTVAEEHLNVGGFLHGDSQP